MIDVLPLWLIGILFFAGMMAAYRISDYLHRKYNEHIPADPEASSHGYVLSGVFGLLALLMAFAFSFAVGRYEERRQLVVAEANAIGTLASRLALLPQADRDDLNSRLAAYAKARVKAGLSDSQDRWNAANEQADGLGDEFGDRLFAALALVPPDTRSPLLVQAYNDVRDRATDRHAARSARLPGDVIGLLAIYCLAGAGILGYAMKGNAPHLRWASSVFFALLAFAFVTILDLDRPRGGSIIVPQEELVRAATKLAG